MSCTFTEKISSLIDGELAPVEAREVESHLVTCVQCSEARADFLNLRSQIANYESSLAPAVKNRALAKILSRGGREKTASRSAATWGWNWGPGWAALASIAIVALVSLVGLILVFIPSKRPEQVALNAPAPVASPTPAPTVEPPKSDNSEKRTETPQRRQPVRKPLVREPKPGEQFAVVPQPVRPADAQTMTALHFEKAETLLRAFRNVRLDEAGSATEVSYERDRARQLVYQNMMLRREADTAGDIQVSSLLENLEPILLDIANLPDKPDDGAVRVIRERVERKNIVAQLQVNSNALARALE
jgi:anti-sigma factor RsiW